MRSGAVICFLCGIAAVFDRESRAWRHETAPPDRAVSVEAWDRDHQVVPAEDV